MMEDFEKIEKIGEGLHCFVCISQLFVFELNIDSNECNTDVIQAHMASYIRPDLKKRILWWHLRRSDSRTKTKACRPLPSEKSLYLRS